MHAGVGVGAGAGANANNLMSLQQVNQNQKGGAGGADLMTIDSAIDLSDLNPDYGSHDEAVHAM